MGRAPTKSSLKAKADRLWSEVIRARDPVCVWCGKRPSRNAHHVFSRRHAATRYLLENGTGLCGGCHIRAHDDAPYFIDFISRKMGDTAYWRIAVLAKSTCKRTVEDYAEVISSLTAAFARVKKVVGKEGEERPPVGPVCDKCSEDRVGIPGIPAAPPQESSPTPR